MLAERQRGAIDRAGLRACGLSDSAITRQIACGRLHPKWPGVYAVGHSRLTREGWWWAALLAGGPGAILALVPQVNAWFPTIAGHGYELDLYWPALRLDVEIDGPRHDLPFQRAKDHRRDADLRTRGITVVRFPTTDVDERPAHFLRELGFVLAQRA